MNKRGQMAIFIIIAFVIIGVILAIYYYPSIKPAITPEAQPLQYLKDCIEPDVQNAINLLASQGGYENPMGAINYNGVNVKYLCYVSGYYQTCMIQQPLLITHFSNEINRMLTAKINSCAQSMKEYYTGRGYSVTMGQINSSVVLMPGKARVEYLTPMTLTKEQDVRKFEKFNVEVDSSIYDLLSIATSIIDYEATYGDSETTTYMTYYPDLKIEKIKLEDGVKIYKLTDVVREESFTFATRSLVWPPGYGLI